MPRLCHAPGTFTQTLSLSFTQYNAYSRFCPSRHSISFDSLCGQLFSMEEKLHWLTKRREGGRLKLRSFVCYLEWPVVVANVSNRAKMPTGIKGQPSFKVLQGKAEQEARYTLWMLHYRCLLYCLSIE